MYLTCSLQEPFLKSMDSVYFIRDLPPTDQGLILFYFKKVEALLINTWHFTMVRTLCLTTLVCPLMTVRAYYTPLILQSSKAWQLLWQ